MLDQAPLVLQEALMLERITMSIAFVICAAFAIAAAWIIRGLFARRQEIDDSQFSDKEVNEAGIAAVSVLIPMPSIGLGIASGYYAIAAWFAPRVFMLEWSSEQLSRLMNG